MPKETPKHEEHLQRSLSPLLLWGLGVGYVISGMYFGWNLGLEKGGTLGMAIATILVIVMYIGFVLCYTELACAIPKAGGAFDYSNRAFGRDGGFVAGMAQNLEFIFAPPAIAAGIGSYLNLYFPSIPPLAIALCVYVIFTLLNILGTKLAASVELVITIVAVLGLLTFAFFTLPEVKLVNLQKNAFSGGVSGIFAAIPFAIWFFLGIEGLANVAEESINPQRDMTKGFGSAMATLVLICVLTFIGSIGVNGWQQVVYNPNGMVSDSPLPLVTSFLLGENHWFHQLLIAFGLFGLGASFHGLIMAAGRATYEFGKVGNAPSFIGKIHPKFKTPTNALLVNMLIGMGALLSNSTADIIILSVMGALTMYAFSIVALLQLRKKEKSLKRPFSTPLYPYFPLISLFIIIASMLAMVFYNPALFMWYAGLMLAAFIGFKLFRSKH